jgi:hypothetical protein
VARGVFYKWDGVTATAISTTTTFPNSPIGGLTPEAVDFCIFNSQLFAGISYSNGGEPDEMYVYTGSGTSWSQDDVLEDEDAVFPYPHLADASPTNGEGRYFIMDCDSTYMFISCRQPVTAGQTSMRMLYRNTSAAYGVVEVPAGGYENPQPQLVGLSKGYTDPLITLNRVSADTYRVVQRGSPNFTNLSASDIGDKRLIGYADGKSFLTVLDGGSGNWELKYSTDWGVNLVAAGNLETSLVSGKSNIVFKDLGSGAIMVAVPDDTLGTGNDIYTWDSVTDTFVADGSISDTLNVIDFFVLNNTLYLLSTSATANSVDIWTAGSTCQAKFYYGTEVPVFTSNLPICGVRPGGMAIAAKSGLVVLGTNGEAGPAVVYGQYPYTGEWSNISGIVPSGTSVSSIKFL